MAILCNTSIFVSCLCSLCQWFYFWHINLFSISPLVQNPVSNFCQNAEKIVLNHLKSMMNTSCSTFPSCMMTISGLWEWHNWKFLTEAWNYIFKKIMLKVFCLNSTSQSIDCVVRKLQCLLQNFTRIWINSKRNNHLIFPWKVCTFQMNFRNYF